MTTGVCECVFQIGIWNDIEHSNTEQSTQLLVSVRAKGNTKSLLFFFFLLLLSSFGIKVQSKHTRQHSQKQFPSHLRILFGV